MPATSGRLLVPSVPASIGLFALAGLAGAVLVPSVPVSIGLFALAGLAGAVLVPSVPASIGLFALAGLAAGPVAPMIMAVGGDRYPNRSAAVGGYLTTAAVVGTIGFPTLMGFLSVTVGLQVAMLGTVALGLASAGALALAKVNREGALAGAAG